MYAPPWSQSASEVIYTNANMDWGAEQLFVEHLNTDGTFIDVGAHVGYYSLYVAPRVGKIYAFEPDVQSFGALSQNLAQCAHAEPVNKAVFSKSGVMEIRKREGTVGFTYLVGPDDDTTSDRHSIEVVSIDDWMCNRRNERVTGIKIDIDGLDYEVLKGAEETIQRDQPLVLTEFSASKTNNFEDLFHLLDHLGYGAFAFCWLEGARYPLRRLTQNEANHRLVKMIFLTPPRLEEFFAARVS